jgi:hypothetical protein
MSCPLPQLAPAAPFDAAPEDRRRAERYDVDLAVEVMTVDGVPLCSRVTNISASGFRTRSPMALAKGTRLVVRFHGGRRRRAHVAWQIGEDIGCRLLRPLSAAELANVVGLL